MGHWKKYLIGDLYNVSSGLSKSRADFSFGNPFVTFKDVFYNNFIPSELNSLANTTEKEIKSCSVKRGDILLTRTSETMDELGMSAVALKDYEKATFNGFTKRLRLKEEVSVQIDPVFIGYYFRSPVIRSQIGMHASMTTRASLNSAAIKSIEIELPNLEVQIKIGEVLKSLDDKIELNRRMNQTLEQMAKALYKHWFVDFGPFQNEEFEESELGMIPKGWEVKNIRGLLQEKPINGLYKGKEFQGYGNRWLKMKSVYGLDIITNQEMELISVTDKDISKYGCLYDDIVFGRTSLVLDGIGKCAIIKSKEDIPILESNLFRIRPDQTKINSNILFLYFSSEKGREEVKKLARQTAAISITSKDLLDILMPVPDIKIQRRFGAKIDDLILNIINNLQENQTLTTLRDTLLPKLMSGEIDVMQAQKQYEPVLS